MNETIKQLSEITSLIKNKQLDEADNKLQNLLDNTVKIEIDQYGKVFDFENEAQFVFYCNQNNDNIKKQWTRNFLSDMYYNKGVILFERGKYLDAIKQYKLALKWNPVKIYAYMEILECYIKLKAVDEFYDNYKKALSLALEPSDISKLYYKHAFLLINLGDYEMAYNILKYSNLICYREENMQEIDYLSSIAKIQLDKNPDIGTINYIRENNLDYKCNPSIKQTYIAIAKSLENYLMDAKGKLTKEEEINILTKLVDAYSKLYFFDGSAKVHLLQINAIRDYIEKRK